MEPLLCRRCIESSGFRFRIAVALFSLALFAPIGFCQGWINPAGVTTADTAAVISYDYKVTAIDASGDESGYSNMAQGVIMLSQYEDRLCDG